VLGDGTNPKLADEALELAKLAKLYKVLPTDYYDFLDGGVYLETIKLNGGEIQDNMQGRRANYAQELLHEKMINLQYER
jgi:hypothetical protein